MGKFGANGARVEIRKLIKSIAPRCQWTYGNLPARSTDVIKWHWGWKMSKLRLLK